MVAGQLGHNGMVAHLRVKVYRSESEHATIRSPVNMALHVTAKMSKTKNVIQQIVRRQVRSMFSVLRQCTIFYILKRLYESPKMPLQVTFFCLVAFFSNVDIRPVLWASFFYLCI